MNEDSKEKEDENLNLMDEANNSLNNVNCSNQDNDKKNEENKEISTQEQENQIKNFNGKWEDMSLNDAINGKKFNNYYSNDIKGFDKVDKVGNYYYLYKKNGSYYDVYYCNKNNKNIRTYLFKTSNIDSVIYFDDVIYYQKDNMIYYYSNYGSRRVLSYSEFEFNSDLSFGVYKK